MSDYSTIYKNFDGDSMLDWRKKDADPYRNLIRDSNQLLFIHKHKDLKKKRVMVEYGCAFGDLLAMMKTLNPGHEQYGVEVVAKVARIAEKRLGKGRIFIQSCEKRTPLKPESTDLVFSFDVIEHVASKKNVEKMFEESNRLLKKDGVCIIVTPNCNWLMKLIYVITGNSWMIDKKFHPNQYSMLELKKEVAQKLRILKVEKGYDLNLFTKGLSWLGIHKHLCIVAGKMV
jgi:SAM-dependent methyltransferase